LVDVQIELT